ncbi:helix-turn-helix domain-containing protein [Neoaquamicrobium sediminum]|uniref:helix-turn-helix domain-containing protein n=1 Tax=Neoaquamicrobium sediminum TaxID=1849104 RepID=UPI001FD17FC8|nr:helix-turn-helix transcriptional regulator [Mesorhizobium sediminum]
MRHNLPVDTISRQVIGKALQLLPAQCRAGRALIEWTIDDLARASAVPAAVIADFETGRTPVEPESIDAIAAALEHGGVRFIPEDGGGAGVRLKFTRSEVARIATLENEGGIIAEDDV